jgi:hypothetical protein
MLSWGSRSIERTYPQSCLSVIPPMNFADAGRMDADAPGHLW